MASRKPRPSYASRHRVREFRAKRHNSWAGQIPVPAKAHPLVRELIIHANDQRTSIEEITAKAGLGYVTIYNWCRHHAPYLPNFIAALNVLDLELVIRKRRPNG